MQQQEEDADIYTTRRNEFRDKLCKRLSDNFKCCPQQLDVAALRYRHPKLKNWKQYLLENRSHVFTIDDLVAIAIASDIDLQITTH